MHVYIIIIYSIYSNVVVNLNRDLSMIMIVAPNSLVRQKEGAQREEEEEAGG